MDDNNFDWIMRGKVYCSEQVANSRDFDRQFDQISWNEESRLVEVQHKGNHRYARHFVLKPDGQEGSV